MKHHYFQISLISPDMLHAMRGIANAQADPPVSIPKSQPVWVPNDHPPIQRQIDATDRQIDQLVYELHGLTDDEIRLVEEATRR